MSKYKIKLIDREGREYKVSSSNMLIKSKKAEKLFDSKEEARQHAEHLIRSGRAKNMSAEIIETTKG